GPGAAVPRAGGVAAAPRLPAPRRAPVAGSRLIADRELARGPARLCQALGISRPQNGADVCDPAGPLRVLAPAGFAGLPAESISHGPRVGVRLGAQEQWRVLGPGQPPPPGH